MIEEEVPVTLEREIEVEIDEAALTLQARTWWIALFLQAPEKMQEMTVHARRAHGREKFVRRRWREMEASGDANRVPRARAEFLLGVAYDLVMEKKNES